MTDASFARTQSALTPVLALPTEQTFSDDKDQSSITASMESARVLES
jgi:hypothetical protein